MALTDPEKARLGRIAETARLEGGSPASLVGELIDVIVKEVEAANQSNSQGTPDTDVQAEKDQAKEGAWELFAG
jgi:hypothetical protein